MSETITKEHLARELNEHLGLSISVCEDLVNNFFTSIVSLVQENSKLTLTRFGRFHLNHKSPRPVMDFKTGKEMLLPARVVLRFTPSKHLKERINKPC